MASGDMWSTEVEAWQRVVWRRGGGVALARRLWVAYEHQAKNVQRRIGMLRAKALTGLRTSVDDRGALRRRSSLLGVSSWSYNPPAWGSFR